MKKLIPILFLFSFSQNLISQNIPHINFVGPWGVQVNTYNGNLYLYRPDLYIPNQSLYIDISFSYNSFRDTIQEGFGKGWCSSYGYRIENISTDTFFIHRPDGRKDMYLLENNIFKKPLGIFDHFEKYGPDKYLLRTKHGMEYHFENSEHGKVTQIINNNGNKLLLNYNILHELTKIEDSSGREVDFIYDNGLLTTISDKNNPTERTIIFSYNENDQLEKVTDAEGYDVRYEYQGNNLIHIYNERNDELHISYNSSGEVNELMTCISQINFSYGEAPKETFVVEKNDNGNQSTNFTYDEDGKLIKKSGTCCGYESSYEYDNDNNIIQLTDANDQVYSSSHDGMGNILLASSPDGNNQYFSFDPTFNKIKNLRDKKGNETTFAYDAEGNLLEVIQPENTVYFFDYYENGNLKSIQDANGEKTIFHYSATNDVEKIEHPIGEERFIYDNTGNVVESIDANGNHVFYEYDQLNRLKKISDENDNDTRFTYDGASNLIMEKDPEGNEKHFFYDVENQLTGVETPNSHAFYTFDRVGNMTSITNGNNHVSSYEYDERNRLVLETDPLGNASAFTYDNNGNVISRTDANGETVAYEYNEMGLLIKKEYAGNTDSYEYDANGNLIRCANNFISMSFTFDALNRMTSKTVENWGMTIGYEYDSAGNRTKMIHPDGKETQYFYDKNNRLIEIINAQNKRTEYQYDDGGRLTHQNYDNGTFTNYEYDNSNRLISLVNFKGNNDTISSYTYEYDKSGNRTKMTDHNNGVANYYYDADNRLANVEYENINLPNDSFEIDSAGNRKKLIRNGNEINYTYNAADQLLSVGSIFYEFNNNGNLIKKTEGNLITQYFYNGEDRLVKIKLPSGENIYFNYDPFGNRISQTGANGEKRYLLDGENLLMELDGNNSVAVRYTTALNLDSWISMERNGETYFYHTDGLGSVTALTNSNENIENTYSYDAFGNIMEQTGAVINNLTYTGREYDAATGIYYYRSRYYDASVGRFLTKDRFKGFKSNPFSLNKYSYVENNPVNYTDPDGDFVLGAIFELIDQLSDNIDNHGKNWECYSFKIDWIDVLSGGMNITKHFKLKYLKDAVDHLQKGIANAHRRFSIGDGKKIRKLIRKLDEFKDEIKKVEKEVDEFIGSAEKLGELFEETTGIDLTLFEFQLDAEECRNLTGGNGSDDPEKGEVPSPIDDIPVLGDNFFCIPIVTSFDPNEIIAPVGFGTEKWVSVNDRLNYTILFENDPDFATAAAQKVVIEHPLDDDINPSSFRLGNFGFGSHYFTVPSDLSFYNTRLDLADSLGVLVDVVAGINVPERKAFWIFESKDPQTGLSTTLPADLGFLPVNDTVSHVGEGFVDFTVRPFATAQTRDTIVAKAEIVFDDNPPIVTNVTYNLIDADAPYSEITEVVPGAEGNYWIEWESTDTFNNIAGSGLHSHLLFASVNGGPFLPVTNNLTGLNCEFQGSPDSSYCFFLLAKDQVRNQEAPKNACEPDCMNLSVAAVTPATAGNADGAIIINVSGGQGDLVFEWYPQLPGADSIASDLPAGSYTVIVTDAAGCIGTLTIEVEVVNGIFEISHQGDLFIHRLYPVPATDYLTIEFSSFDQLVFLQVFDMQGNYMFGKTIRTTQGNMQSEVLPIGELPPGNYLVRIDNRKGENIKGVFVKVR